MDFNQVRYFLALADTLNFTRAAEQCYVSQPSLTQAIKRLENELGGKLIHRDGRYTELTELGKSLRGHFEQIDRTRHLVRSTAKAVTSGEIAELDIGVMCTIGPRVLPRLLETFRKRHPMTSIVLHDVLPTAIPDLLLTGTLDGVFCARHGPPHPLLHSVSLFEETMVIAFPDNHEFSQRDYVSLNDITKQDYIDRLHCEFREEVNESFNQQNLQLEVVFRSEREDWIQSLVRDGMGVTCIPRYSLLQPELDHRPIIDPVLVRTVEFTIAKNANRSPALNMLMEEMTNYDWPKDSPITER